MPARTLGELVADGLHYVGRVVVHHNMNLGIRSNVGLDVIQKCAECRSTVALVALSDDFACGSVESCDQGGHVIVRVFMGAPLSPGQVRSRA